MNDINASINKITQFSLPNWEELPAITLYLDQVLEYVNAYLMQLSVDSSFKDKIITSAMVNNYVKHQIISAPSKKRYGKEQIADLLMIGIIKHALSINNIKNYLKYLNSTADKATIYTNFIEEFQLALKQLTKQCEISDSTAKIEFQQVGTLPLRLATSAVTNKLMAEYLLNQTILSK